MKRRILFFGIFSLSILAEAQGVFADFGFHSRPTPHIHCSGEVRYISEGQTCADFNDAAPAENTAAVTSPTTTNDLTVGIPIGDSGTITTDDSNPSTSLGDQNTANEEGAQITGGGADSGQASGNTQTGGVPDTGNSQTEAGGVPDTGPELESLTVEFENPIAFGNVNDLLSGVLGAIQAIIASLAVLFIVIGAVIYMTSGGNSGRIELAKNAIWAAVIGLALALAAPSFLAEIYSVLAPGSPEAGASALTLTAIILNVLKFLLSIVGVLAVTMLVAGGLMYMLSAGDQSRLDTGKKIVLYAIIGLVVALVSLVVVTQIANVFA